MASRQLVETHLTDKHFDRLTQCLTDTATILSFGRQVTDKF